MPRKVRRDGGQIVSHLIREVRDETTTSLSYDAQMAELVFLRDTRPSAPVGAGSLKVVANHAAIAALPEAERHQVGNLLGEIAFTFKTRCSFYSADRLRTVIRAIIEHLGAVRVRPSGGVYFVHRAHAEVVAALKELVDRMGEDSQLWRIPIPDQDEMREMIIKAFTDQAKEDLDKLAAEIAAAGRNGASQEETAALYRRFTQLQQATTKHAALLSTTLDDTDSALRLVNLQLAGLLAGDGGQDDEDED